MNEHQVIQAFAKIHGLQTHRADAERFGGMLFSVDSFSEHEDFFANTPPEDIGHDLAVGACTDLLACGVRPEGLFQAWNLDDAHPQSYYEAVARGIEAVLAHYGARCIGGDVGGASPWCWTATVVARCPPTGGVTRIAARREPFELYASGRFGAANLAVFGGQPMPRFALREPVPADALFATDSSGGFFDALENFRRVNTGMRLRLELSSVLPQGVPPQVDPMLTLVGGVGEYELLYAVPAGMAVPGIRIGEGDFIDATENDFSWSCGDMAGAMSAPPPDYRGLAPEAWLPSTIQYLKEMTH